MIRARWQGDDKTVRWLVGLFEGGGTIQRIAIDNVTSIVFAPDQPLDPARTYTLAVSERKGSPVDSGGGGQGQPSEWGPAEPVIVASPELRSLDYDGGRIQVS